MIKVAIALVLGVSLSGCFWDRPKEKSLDEVVYSTVDCWTATPTNRSDQCIESKLSELPVQSYGNRSILLLNPQDIVRISRNVYRCSETTSQSEMKQCLSVMKDLSNGY